MTTTRNFQEPKPLLLPQCFTCQSIKIHPSSLKTSPRPSILLHTHTCIRSLLVTVPAHFRTPHLMLTLIIRVKADTVKVQRGAAPVDAHVVADWGKFDTIFMDFGTWSSPEARAGRVTILKGGEPAIIASFWEAARICASYVGRRESKSAGAEGYD